MWGLSVLHVDDHPDFVDLAATFLEREGEALTVLTKTNVDAALGSLDGGGDGESVAVDCVVSDCDMLGRDGLEFLGAVRERYPRRPFLLFTGEGDEPRVTGFGLRIVRDIVEAHGWRIECVAGESGGARFEVTGVDVG